MPSMRRPQLLGFVLALVLAAPSTALAQGAGDDQYSDPFAGGGGSSQSDGGDSGSGNSGSAPVAPAPATQTAQADTSDSAPAEAAPSGELPRTGLDAGPLALAGGALLLSGVALRRRAGA